MACPEIKKATLANRLFNIKYEGTVDTVIVFYYRKRKTTLEQIKALSSGNTVQPIVQKQKFLTELEIVQIEWFVLKLKKIT